MFSLCTGTRFLNSHTRIAASANQNQRYKASVVALVLTLFKQGVKNHS